MKFIHRLATAFPALFLFTVVACHSPRLLLDENRGNLATARTVAAAFQAEYGRALGQAEAPFVTLGFKGGSGYELDGEHDILFLTPFSHADFDVQRLFHRATDDERGQALYNDLMFRYFTAHQLMHLVYDELPHVAGEADARSYEQELDIHTMTWLFLQEHDLMPADEREVIAALGSIEAQLARRFPGVGEGVLTPDEIAVDHNDAYWYVTAVSLQAARRRADTAGSQGRYLASLATRGPVGVGAAVGL